MQRGWFVAIGFMALACGGAPKKEGPTAPKEARPARETQRPAEPQEDEELEVEGLLGTLEMSEVQPLLSRHESRLIACYEKQPGLPPYVGGQVELKFRVNRDGSLKHVQIGNGDLGAWPVEKCLLGVARSLTFPKPRGGEAEFRFPLEFSGRGSVAVMNEDQARRELSGKFRELAKCDVSGVEAQVTVYIGAHGAVTSAGLTSLGQEPFSDEWADCAVDKAMSWTLSDPRGRIVKASTVYRGGAL
jgi:hypothetical protein